MNNKIKLCFINAGVIGVTILGGYMYGQVQYIRGILDTSKELKKGSKRNTRVSYSDYSKYKEDRA